MIDGVFFSLKYSVLCSLIAYAPRNARKRYLFVCTLKVSSAASARSTVFPPRLPNNRENGDHTICMRLATKMYPSRRKRTTLHCCAYPCSVSNFFLARIGPKRWTTSDVRKDCRSETTSATRHGMITISWTLLWLDKHVTIYSEYMSAEFHGVWRPIACDRPFCEVISTCDCVTLKRKWDDNDFLDVTLARQTCYHIFGVYVCRISWSLAPYCMRSALCEVISMCDCVTLKRKWDGNDFLDVPLARQTCYHIFAVYACRISWSLAPYCMRSALCEVISMCDCVTLISRANARLVANKLGNDGSCEH